jgi:4-hydroxyphenylpyruvate dioxygenase-like putative hemolysin
VDAWLGFLPGCDYMGLRAGQWVLTPAPSNQRVQIIGFSNNYIKDEQVDAAKKPAIEMMGLTMKFQVKSKAICMYEQNGLLEIIEADPSSLSSVEAIHGASEETSLPLFDDKEVIN